MTRLLVTLLLLATLPGRVWAWGMEGHRAIGNIAEQYVSNKASRKIAALLGTQTLTMVSTQPDEMRYLPEYKDTGPWHYVNTPPGLAQEVYLKTVKEQTTPNAYNVLMVKIKEMADATLPRAQRAEALIFVVHLVGDIHQPLHAGRAEDKGGNDIKLTYRGKDTNLHSLWDSGLLEYQGLTYTEMGAQYTPMSEREVSTWMAVTDPAQWLWESYTLAGKLYTEAAENPNPDFRYYPAHADMLKERIQQAGIRLAAVLNAAFD